MAAEEIRRIREEWDLPTTKVEEGEDGALENMMSGLAESAEVRACAEMYGSGEDLDFGNWTKEPAKVLGGHPMRLTLNGLLQTHGSCSFRLDDEHPGMMRMQDFLEYVRKDAFGDAAPLYIFDSQMWRREEMSQLTAQFTAPKWLPRDESHDMFKVIDDEEEEEQVARGERPPWRWLLFGPRRSGWGIHKDPLSTCAWNTVISGRKLWMFFPPETEASLLGCDANLSAYGFFTQTLPSIFCSLKGGAWPKHCAPQWTLQGPGETIWIPANWWHVAINIEECFAVTQNLALSRDMNRVIADLFHIEPYACKQFFSSHRLHGRLKENAFRALHRCGGSIRDLEHHDE